MPIIDASAMGIAEAKEHLHFLIPVHHIYIKNVSQLKRNGVRTREVVCHSSLRNTSIQ